MSRHAIDVVPAQRGKASVKTLRSNTRPVQPHVRRQHARQAAHQILRAGQRALLESFHRDVRMADLTAGMHARVCTPGNDQLNGMAGDQRQLPLQHSRDRA